MEWLTGLALLPALICGVMMGGMALAAALGLRGTRHHSPPRDTAAERPTGQATERTPVEVALVNPRSPDPGADRDPAIANADQASAWDGDEGAHWVAHQDRYEAMTGVFTERLREAAALARTTGCSTSAAGRPTRLAALHARDGQALGIDLSTAMLERARSQAHVEASPTCSSSGATPRSTRSPPRPST